ncbi:MAG: type IVB secretion system protein IcmG/DotF [Legionellaceae bacterium]|nr:type IVB secretion system protein IcmG/DotF [Legionellaceae bacterium]
MADKDTQVEDIGDNDEYQFADLDGLGTESLDAGLAADEADFEEADESEEGVSSPPGRGRIDPDMMKIIKKGVFVVGGLILFVLTYKLILSFWDTSPKAVNKQSPVVAKKVAPVQSVQPKVATPLPVQVSAASNDALNQTEKKVKALEEERNRLKTDVFAMQQQLRDVTQTVSNMTSSLDSIKQSMEQINDKMDQQSQQMVRLQSIKRAQRRASTPSVKKITPKVEATQYFIQAIIPGRAWLMSTKGKTLTVSRGSEVPGYGDVRLINPKLGRIFTSSGRVIQFSQADS